MNTSRPELQILLVEDSASDAMLIEEALSDVPDFDLQFVHTERLSDAVAQAQAGYGNVVLLDLGLPDAQGLDTFRQFHRQVSDVPVLVLTGLDDISIGLQAIQEGAQDYVLKRDIDASLLSRAIRYAIERHRVIAALAASEERFQLAVSGASAGLWDWDPQTGAAYFSPHLKEILGYRDHELPNDKRALVDAIHPGDIKRFIVALAAHLKRRRPYDVECRVRVRSGAFRWIECRGQALWNSAGIPYRMVGWIMDITDRKRSEEALRLSREELRRLSAHVQHVREEEQARIARELHDDFGQQLTAMKLVVARVEHEMKRGTPPSNNHLPTIYTMIDELVDSVRRIAADLRPTMLDDLGLIPAIEWMINDFTARHGVPVVAHVAADGTTFNRESATAVFRIVQEALTNIARHSGATNVTLEIVRDEPYFIVRISDNGRGASPDARPMRQALGLLGLRERATRLGGNVHIDTAPDQGFRLTVKIPLAAVEEVQPG